MIRHCVDKAFCWSWDFPQQRVAGGSTFSRHLKGHLLWDFFCFPVCASHTEIPGTWEPASQLLHSSRSQDLTFWGLFVNTVSSEQLEVEFCYSSVLPFSLKDSYKGELRGNACPSCSHCSHGGTFITPSLKGTGGQGKGIVSRIFWMRHNCHALKPKSLFCIQ